MEALTSKLGRILATYGGWGVFAVSFLDSTFVPMPGFNDLLLLHLCSRRPALAPLYVLQCTLGSLLGCYIVYGLGRGGGRLFRRGRATKNVESADSGAKVKAVRRGLERNDFVSVLVFSLLPPPAPFKVLVATAGALRVNPLRFGLALLVGRGLRFSVEGWLGARYGAQAEAYVRHHLGPVSLALAIVIAVGTLAFRRLTARQQAGDGGRG